MFAVGGKLWYPFSYRSALFPLSLYLFSRAFYGVEEGGGANGSGREVSLGVVEGSFDVSCWLGTKENSLTLSLRRR